MNNIDKSNITDRQLRELMHANAPEAPQNPWFVRKVMNRLPDKPATRKRSVAEILCYVIGVLGLLVAWTYSIHSTATNGLTVSTLVMSGVLTLLTLFCIGVFAFPMVRKAL